jgi:hypothetical protein
MGCQSKSVNTSRLIWCNCVWGSSRNPFIFILGGNMINLILFFILSFAAMAFMVSGEAFDNE